MRKSFFVLAAVACCACSKGVVGSSDVKNEMVELSFRVPVAASKVSGPVAEDAVESLQVFVFGEDGQVQSSGVADGNALTLTCSTGEKEIAAVVNASTLEGINNLSILKARMADFGDNALGHFVMSGVESKNLEASGSVEIPVSRRVSKVSLASVTRSFVLEQHKTMDFELLSVFLTNVPEETGLFQALQSDALINEGESDMDVIKASYGDLLFDDLAAVSVAQGETADVGRFLYCYPNVLTDVTRPAYLVLQTRLGDGVYYYSIELPQMEANKCYNVSLTVTMPGSLTPNVPVSKEDAVFSVNVADWAGNIDVNETI